MKLNWLWKLLGIDTTLVVRFGGAQLIRTLEGRLELAGGTVEDRQRVREWISMFWHEANPAARK